MLTRAVALVLFFSLITGAGGHITALQAIAWIQMTIERAGYESPAALVQSIFSGQKPCSLCRKVKILSQKQAEQEKTTKIQWNKTETLLTESVLKKLSIPDTKVIKHPFPSDVRLARSIHAPLTPPPKI
jgi:hypothetical protein